MGTFARQGGNKIADGSAEGLVFDVLLVNFHVVFQQDLRHPSERLVVRHARGVRCVLLRVLVGRVRGDFRGDVFADALDDAVGIGEQCGEVLIAFAYHHFSEAAAMLASAHPYSVAPRRPIGGYRGDLGDESWSVTGAAD